MFSIDPTLALISRGLDACSLRQAVYASNVANVNTPGYQPLEVQFESALRSAADSMSAIPVAEQSGILDTIQPSVVPAATGSVELDQQVALMAQNAFRYETLVNAFERSMGLLRLAISEGKNG
jgi:flagellar basal-body rod protein FlgB